MTAPTLAAPVTGAPYMIGDPVRVYVNTAFVKGWRDATVQRVERLSGPGRFGLVWRLRVTILSPGSTTTLDVLVDDNGRNNTIQQQVRPSDLVGS